MERASWLVAAVLLVGISGCTADPGPGEADPGPQASSSASAIPGTSTSRSPASPSPSLSPSRPPAGAPLPEDVGLTVETLAEDLPALTNAGAPPGDDRVFAASQEGQVLLIAPGGGDPAVVLDLTDRVVTGAEQGLLEITFHPTFADTGRFLVHYTAAPDGDTRIVEYRMPPGGGPIDPATGEVVFALDQPHRWHNGGQLAFGPEGHLWIALGDGGPGGDPEGRAQDTSNVYGAILRIDLEGSGGAHGEYGIPSDNPFATVDGAAPEIWAYGLRNPWQFSLDPAGGHIWIGDVGQYIYEEIDVLPLDGGGANLGWAIREGLHCYDGEPCEGEDLVDPVAEYVHDEGRCAIVGGPVYRGAALPGLWGHYLYTDACSGELWSLLYDEGEVREQRDLTDFVGAFATPSSFGLDGAGEVLVSTLSGSVLRLVPSS